MASINKVILVGNVGRDPEVRYVEKDLAVATFSLATSERYSKDGKLIEHTEWHRIVAWRRLAKLAEQFIKKGSQLYIEGKLQTRSFTDKQNQQHFVTEIVANEIQLLDKKPKEDAEPAAPFTPDGNEPAFDPNLVPPTNDKLPF